MKKHNVLFTFGNTGGHIYPALALVEENDFEHSFIGAKNSLIQKSILKNSAAFFPIEPFSKNPIKVLKNIILILRYFQKIKPTLVIGLGGQNSFLVIVVAWILRKRIILMEQNALPGRVNKRLAFMANQICVSFEHSLNYFNKTKCLLTGNPIRTLPIKDKCTEELEAVIDVNMPILTVIGGSQGHVHLIYL